MSKVEQQAKRGLLPWAIFEALSTSPQHGYSLLEALPKIGISGIQSGYLYPLLRKLEEEGTIESSWEIHEGEKPKKVFTLTETGKFILKEVRMIAASIERKNHGID